jgi:hypothetical protein
MAAFGRLFDSLRVSGYTWVHWQNDITLTIPRGATVNDLRDVWRPFEKWLAPGAPAMAQLASMARSAEKKITLPMEWYQYTLEEKPPYVANNFERFGRHNYKVRSEAKNRTLQAKDARPSAAAIPPFEYVTVEVRSRDLRDI